MSLWEVRIHPEARLGAAWGSRTEGGEGATGSVAVKGAGARLHQQRSQQRTKGSLDHGHPGWEGHSLGGREDWVSALM